MCCRGPSLRTPSAASQTGPYIFELALARLGAEPCSALFVDDTPSHVVAAQALGIAGYVHTGTRTTAAAIESFAGTA
jgi:putative hydrolase of the HAD superfamily